MSWKTTLTAAAVISAAAFAQSAYAGVVLSDNFNDGSTSSLSWAGDSVFSSPSSEPGYIGTQTGTASTDYVASTNSYGITCAGPYGCVDLDGTEPVGTANPAGVLQSNASFGPGTYVLSFDISGNQRGAVAQSTNVYFGSFLLTGTPIALASGSGWETVIIDFTSATGGTLDFVEANENNDVGNLLDNVTLTSSVPEPATWALMLAGFGGLGLVLRRRTRLAAI